MAAAEGEEDEVTATSIVAENQKIKIFKIVSFWINLIKENSGYDWRRSTTTYSDEGRQGKYNSIVPT